jgi:uncharacterized membrane protein
MDTLIHADIFFFVSTIALIVLSIGALIALIYIIRILRNVTHVSDKVKEESDEILKDMRELRGNIKSEGFSFRRLGRFFGKMFRSRKSKK